MNSLTRYFFIIHTILIFAAGIGVWLIVKSFFPEIQVKGYFIIPLNFYLIGLIFIFRIRKTSVGKPSHIVNLYLVIKMVKIFSSLGIIFLYWITNQTDIRSFALLFVIFYLISLILETFIYLRMEKYQKSLKDLNKLQDNQERTDI